MKNTYAPVVVLFLIAAVAVSQGLRAGSVQATNPPTPAPGVRDNCAGLSVHFIKPLSSWEKMKLSWKLSSFASAQCILAEHEGTCLSCKDIEFVQDAPKAAVDTTKEQTLQTKK